MFLRRSFLPRPNKQVAIPISLEQISCQCTGGDRCSTGSVSDLGLEIESLPEAQVAHAPRTVPYIQVIIALDWLFSIFFGVLPSAVEVEYRKSIPDAEFTDIDLRTCDQLLNLGRFAVTK